MYILKKNRIEYDDKAFLIFVKKWSWNILLIASLIQCTLFFDIKNVFAVFIVIAAWKLADVFVFRKALLEKYTLSTYVLIGFSLTQYFLPVVFTLIEGKALIYNLDYPYEVFTHSIVGFIIIILAHYTYTHFQNKSNIFKNKLQILLLNFSFFRAPKDSQIWAMGMIGLFSMFVSYFFIKQSYENYSEGTINKFIEGLIPFTYAPYFLLLKDLYSKNSVVIKGSITKVAIFSIPVLIVGIGGNARALFITGMVASGLGYFLGLLLGKFNYKIFNFKNTLISVLLVWILTGPLSDLGTAMVIVRNQRGTISKTEMLIKTLDTYNKKNEIQFYKKIVTNSFSGWDEHYFDNIFLARFCNLKFNDTGFKQYDKIGGVDSKMQEYTMDRFWSVFPKPILYFFSIEVDKDVALSYSIGDYLYFRAGGVNALGGFRTGHFASTGMASFGLIYLLILYVGIIPVYFLVDLFVYRIKIGESTYKTFISLAGLLPLTSIFMFLSLSSTSQSVIFLFTYITRDWIQLTFLYWLVYWICRRIA